MTRRSIFITLTAAWLCLIGPAEAAAWGAVCKPEPAADPHVAAWTKERLVGDDGLSQLGRLRTYVDLCKPVHDAEFPAECTECAEAQRFCKAPLSAPVVSLDTLKAVHDQVTKDLIGDDKPKAPAFSVSWQDAVIRGLAAFLVKRAKATAAAHMLERIRSGVCADPRARTLLSSSCLVFDASDPFTSPISWQSVRAALIRDLRRLPETGLILALQASPCRDRWLDAADVVVSAARLFDRLRRGDDVVGTIVAMYGDVRAYDPAWGNAPGRSALAASAVLTHLVGPDLSSLLGADDPVSPWKPTDYELKLLTALIAHQMDGSELKKRWDRHGLDRAVAAVEAHLLRLETMLVALRRLKRPGLADPDAAYRAFATEAGRWFASIGRLLLESPTPGTNCREESEGACVQAAFRAAERVSGAFEAVRAGDYSAAYVDTIAALDVFVAPEQLPDWLRKFIPFFITIAAADDAAEMEGALEAFAAPPGSHLAKRRGGSPGTRVSLNAYLGVAGGGEVLLADKALPGGRIGPFAPIGIEIGRSLPRSSSVGVFIPVLELGALLDYRVRDGEDTTASDADGTASVKAAPKIGFAQIVSPGVFAVFGLGKSPLSLGLGGVFTPRLRDVTSGGESVPVAAFRFGAFFAVDIPLLFLR